MSAADDYPAPSYLDRSDAMHEAMCDEIDRLRATVVLLEDQVDQGDVGMDWLLGWTMAHDQNAAFHYWHIHDDIRHACGCAYQEAAER